jgi:2-keto-4-pentenoate hydratase/2-oxohepta-3-ene-1,7-dioic acid hydratase in catechol pathway
VVIPRQSSLPDYEGELAVVLSKDCKDATLENALECVLGYTVANDVSARCWQADTSVPDQCLIQNETYHPKPIGPHCSRHSFAAAKIHCVKLGISLEQDLARLIWITVAGQWSFSKSFDTHCPLGPALVTVDVLGKAAGLQLQTHLNGKLMQVCSVL